MKRAVVRIFSVVQIALVVAVLSCGGKQDEGGADLINKGLQAEKAGKRTEALDAYTRAVQASNLTREQLTYAVSVHRGGFALVWGGFRERCGG